MEPLSFPKLFVLFIYSGEKCVLLFFVCVCVCLALNMTSASSFQMLRGAVIIFTGLLSVAFLGRRLVLSQWLGILTTILGLVIVGLADFFSGHHDDSRKLSDVITGRVAFFTYDILHGESGAESVLRENVVKC